MARSHTVLEEATFHGVARQSERLAEMLARDLVPPDLKLKLAKRSVVEGVFGEAIRVGDRTDLFEPALVIL